MRTPSPSILWTLLITGAMACGQRSDPEAGGAPATTALSPRDSTGVGHFLAARAPVSCPGAVPVTRETCRSRYNAGTRRWDVVCRVAPRRLAVVDTSGLASLPRDSTGVGHRDSSGVSHILAAGLPGPICASMVPVNAENCRWRWNAVTKGWDLVCEINGQTVVVQTSALVRLSRDSSGVSY